MKKRKVYIFMATGRAAVYGIGTYLENLIKVLQSSNLEFGVVHLYSEGNEMKVIEKEGYEQFFIPFPSSNKKDAHKYYNRNVAYLLKEYIPENRNTEYIFHLNSMGNETLVKNLKKKFNCKVISVIHYTDWSFSLNGNFAKLKKMYVQELKTLPQTDKNIVQSVKNDLKTLKKSDSIVCVSRHTHDTYRKIGGLRDKQVEIIANALKDGYIPVMEKTKQDLRKKYLIGETEKVILFAGRLDEVKGVKYLISAFKDILSKNPDTRLIIAGNGNYDELLKESLNCCTRINFTGKLDKKNLYEFYCFANMGVVCSLHEEFGMVAIEMMMHSLPLIVSKTSGLDEIVEDGISGLKIPVRIRNGERQVDVKILSGKIDFLLNNPEIGKTLGENARKRFLEKYELSLFKDKMLNLYQTV